MPPSRMRTLTSSAGNNERLEFLGDAVLGVIVSRILYDRFPDADEGALTAHRAALVNRTSLASVAEELRLDQHLLLGRGELEAGGSHRPSLLAGALEALVGRDLPPVRARDRPRPRSDRS